MRSTEFEIGKNKQFLLENLNYKAEMFQENLRRNPVNPAQPPAASLKPPNAGANNRSMQSNPNNRSAMQQQMDQTSQSFQGAKSAQNSSMRQGRSKGPSQGGSGPPGGYQPSVLFKPGQAQKQLQSLKQTNGGDSDRQMYSTQQPRQQLQPPAAGYEVNPGAPQQPPAQGMRGLNMPRQAADPRSFQAQYSTNPRQPVASVQMSKPVPFQPGTNYPRQAQAGTVPQSRPYVSPQGQRRLVPDGYKLSKSPNQARVTNMPQQVAQKRGSSQGGAPIQTHQVQGYHTAQPAGIPPPQNGAGQRPPIDFAKRFHPEQNQISYIAGDGELGLDESNGFDEDDELRDMATLVAELRQECSDLKKRQLFQQRMPAQPPSRSTDPKPQAQPQPRPQLMQSQGSQRAKSSSLSPSTGNNRSASLSRTNNSNFSNDTGSGKANPYKQRKSLSPKITAAQQQQQQLGAGSEYRDSQTSQEQRARASQRQSNPAAATDAHDGQWASPNDNQRVQHAAPGSLSQSNNTLALTVSVNQDHHQERLFRLSPLSSKMQEDTEGEGGSSHRNFFMNQSINDSQLDSASPEGQPRQQSNQPDMHLERDQLAQTTESIPRGEEMDAAELEQQVPSSHPVSEQASPPHQHTASRSQTRQASAAQRQSHPRAETPAEQNAYSTRAFSRSAHHRSVLQENSTQSPPRADAYCQTEHDADDDASRKPVEDTVSVIQPSTAQADRTGVETQDGETQTARRDFQHIQLTPFDTYDLYFVKDLVNDLSKDNEVLQDSNQDLKYAFRFLVQKHKLLQNSYEKEVAKNVLLGETKERLVEVTKERDQALEQGMVLHEKCLSMNRVIQLAVQEQVHMENEAQALIAEVENENKMLRELLKISEDYSKPATVAEIEKTVRDAEKKSQELAYKAEMQLREAREKELETLKSELQETMESTLQTKYEQKTQELEQYYQEKTAKQESETQLLKKALLEQSLQRLNQLSLSREEGDSQGDNSLENSQKRNRLQSSLGPSVSGSEGEVRTSTASQRNNLANLMQQELDEFADFFDGPLSQEEQDLIRQLKQNEIITKNGQGHGSDAVKEQVEEQDADGGKLTVQALQAERPRDGTGPHEEEEEEIDEFADDDFEQFGVEAESPTDSEKQRSNAGIVQVVTKPSPDQALTQAAGQELRAASDRYRDADAEGEDMYHHAEEDNQIEQFIQSMPYQHQEDEEDEEDYQMDQDKQQQPSPSDSSDDAITAPKQDRQDQAAQNEELDFRPGEQEQDQVQQDPQPKYSKKEAPMPSALDRLDNAFDGEFEDDDRQEVLRQKYDEYFAAENNGIEDEVDENDSESDGSEQDDQEKLSPRSFELAVQRQKSDGSSKRSENEAKQPQREQDVLNSDLQQVVQQKHDGEQPANIEFSEPLSPIRGGEAKQSFDEAFEFSPPKQNEARGTGEQTAPQFFLQEEYNILAPGQSKDRDRKKAINDFVGGGDGIDDEDRRFFEELSRGFSAKNEQQEPGQTMFEQDQNEQIMDDTKQTRQLAAMARNERLGTEDPDQNVDDREEAKEEEYDYFLDHIQEENSGNAQGYHVIDEKDLQEDDEDLEELDEEEKAQRHREMLKDFKEKMEREDAKRQE